jgi:prepilin-type N-terminal cleavage/methylation domain-containing protein
MDTTMRTEQGFTLVEVMVAMVVLSLALFELGRMQIVSLRTTASASRLSQATSIAQDRVEQLMALAYNAPVLTDNTPVGQMTTYTDPNPPAGYSIMWDVDTNNPAVDTKTVNVRVTWNNLGKTKTFALSLQKGA